MPAIKGWTKTATGWTWGNWTVTRHHFGRWVLKEDGLNRQFFDKATDAVKEAHQRQTSRDSQKAIAERARMTKASAAAHKAWATRRAKNQTPTPAPAPKPILKPLKPPKLKAPPKPKYRPGQKWRSIDDE